MLRCLQCQKLRSLVAQERQPDPLATDIGQRHVGDDEGLVVQRAFHDDVAGRAEDRGAAPEGDRLVHADAVAEHDHARRQLRVGAQEGLRFGWGEVPGAWMSSVAMGSQRGRKAGFWGAAGAGAAGGSW